MKKIFITFAGVMGCGKTPIANYISTKLCLPTFNTDAIRSEVSEDFLKYDEVEAQKRIKKRLQSVIKEGKSFIYDASVDRKRPNLKEVLREKGYKTFILSIDLDKETLLNFYKAKSYSETQMIDRMYEEHQNFLKEFSEDVNIHINENNYDERLELVYKAVSQRMKDVE